VRELLNIVVHTQIHAIDDDPRNEHVIIENLNNDNTIDARRIGPDTRDTTTGGRPSRKDITEALQQTNGHQLRAAQLLGISEKSLYRHLNDLK